MAAHEDSPDLHAPDPVPPLRRKPYRKPEFRFERVFETSALSCGKIAATQGQCRFNRKSS